MKVDQFKELVRAIVKEEIKKSLPTLVPQIVAEALAGKVKKPQIVEDDSDFFEQLKNDISGNHIPATAPKTQKKYSSNPLLNQVLNETEGGVLPDPEYTMQVPQPSFKQPAKKLNVIQQTSPSAPIINETTKAQAELGVFKDYRKLMKAVDSKKKTGGFGGGAIGGFNVEGGIPRDFSTID